MKAFVRRSQSSPATIRRQPMFRLTHGRRQTAEPFFRLQSPQDRVVQRQEAEEEKNPLTEGLKITGEQLLKNPKFKTWYKPKLELLKSELWEKLPPEDKAALITFGALNLGVAGTAFATSPELREQLSGVNIGKPLGWIPYSPVEGFKYTLPKPGQSAYGFSADFTLNPYLKALREKYPGVPLSALTLGLNTAYDPTSKGFSVTGGKFGLEFFGGGLKVGGKTFTELSPYPLLLPGATPTEPTTTLMQSVPGLPPLQTGSGFQVGVTADLLKLFPGLRRVF